MRALREYQGADVDGGRARNAAADTSAAAMPPTSAGNATPTAWISSAAASSVGRDRVWLSRAHSAEDGSAASPARTHAPVPAQRGAVRLR